jgi:hypothetical protein
MLIEELFSKISTRGILTVHLECGDKFQTHNVKVRNSKDAKIAYDKYTPVIGWKKVGYTFSGRV